MVLDGCREGNPWRLREGRVVTPVTLEVSRPLERDSLPRGALFRKLKPGPGHSAEEVFADQHARLQGAMVELVAENGYSGLTVRDLSRAAGVSTRTFYRHFGNAEECLACTCESLMTCALRRATGSRKETGEQSVRGGLRSLLQGLAEHPKAARLVLFDSFGAGPDLLEQTELAIREHEQLLLDAFAEAPEQTAIPQQMAQGMVAGVMRVARTRLDADQAGELPEIAGELADWTLSLRGIDVADRGDNQVPVDGVRSRSRDRGSLPHTFPKGIGGERERILAAAAKLSSDDGYRTLTVTKIRAEAGVSRRTFDAQFASLEECFLEAVEELALTAARRAEQRAAGAADWENGVRRGSLALCTEIARHSALAQLGFIEILAPGQAGLQRRERLVTLGADRLREAAPAEDRPSELAAEASAAAAWRIVHAEVAAGRSRELPRVAPTVAHALTAPMTAAPEAAQAGGDRL
jgi:AcrR family transcriptional regulator